MKKKATKVVKAAKAKKVTKSTATKVHQPKEENKSTRKKNEAKFLHMK